MQAVSKYRTTQERMLRGTAASFSDPEKIVLGRLVDNALNDDASLQTETLGDASLFPLAALQTFLANAIASRIYQSTLAPDYARIMGFFDFSDSPGSCFLFVWRAFELSDPFVASDYIIVTPSVSISSSSVIFDRTLKGPWKKVTLCNFDGNPIDSAFVEFGQ